jgi:hypothetical protein
VRPRRPATTRGIVTHPGSGHGLPNLRRGEGPRRQFRVAETDLDLDDTVPPHTRADGERQLEEGELEIFDL